jgi:hypothetical protein
MIAPMALIRGKDYSAVGDLRYEEARRSALNC